MASMNIYLPQALKDRMELTGMPRGVWSRVAQREFERVVTAILENPPQEIRHDLQQFQGADFEL